ncbi:hypothetical protein L208DRAFT_1241670, partial [Tricholoma matsutake]
MQEQAVLESDTDQPTNESDKDCEPEGPSCLHKSKKSNSILQFSMPHPLIETHGLKHFPAPLVPNFVGQTLPHRDQGDREFYCTTMLTLFKPWWSGSSLKLVNESWDEASVSHKFTGQEEKIMRNFNICYECLDQRDDFLTELKKGATAVPGWLDDEFIPHEMKQSGVLDELDHDCDAMQADEIEIDNLQSHRYHQQMKSMSLTKLIMTKLGWM